MFNTATPSLAPGERTRIRVRALVEAGVEPVAALRLVCGDKLVDDMIDTLYHELRRRAGVDETVAAS